MGLRRSDAGLKAEFFSFLSVHLSAPLSATPLRLPTVTSTETSPVLSALSLFTKLMLGHFPERNNWVCSLRSKETTSLRSRSPRIFLRNHHECDPAPTLLRCWLTVSSRKWTSIDERSALAHHKKAGDNSVFWKWVLGPGISQSALKTYVAQAFQYLGVATIIIFYSFHRGHE